MTFVTLPDIQNPNPLPSTKWLHPRFTSFPRPVILGLHSRSLFSTDRGNLIQVIARTVWCSSVPGGDSAAGRGGGVVHVQIRGRYRTRSSRITCRRNLLRRVLHPALCARQINQVRMDRTFPQADKVRRLQAQEHLMDLLGRLSRHLCFPRQYANNSSSSQPCLEPLALQEASRCRAF